MIKFDSNKGITIAVLLVAIVVVVILLGIVINIGVDSIDDSMDEQFKSELYIVQQVIYQKQIEYQEKGSSAQIIGEEIEDILNYKGFINAYNKVYGKEPEGTYYLITNKVEDPSEISSFEKLGLTGKRVDNSEFIVNYETGEVYNNTKRHYSNGVTPMYLPGYNIYENTEKNKNNVIEIYEDALEIDENVSN